MEPDALPARVIKDSQTNYAIFGPGARKGAYLMDGGEAAYDVLNDDQDINQEEALARAGHREGLPRRAPSDRVGGGVERRRDGRAYDIEAAEHNLWLVRRGPRPHPRGGRRSRHPRACQGSSHSVTLERARGRLAPQPRARTSSGRSGLRSSRRTRAARAATLLAHPDHPSATRRASATARALSDDAPAADGSLHVRARVSMVLRTARPYSAARLPMLSQCWWRGSGIGGTRSPRTASRRPSERAHRIILHGASTTLNHAATHRCAPTHLQPCQCIAADAAAKPCRARRAPQ